MSERGLARVREGENWREQDRGEDERGGREREERRARQRDRYSIGEIGLPEIVY